MNEQWLAWIEDLSLKMVIGGADVAQTLAALSAIEKQARQAGTAPVADCAQNLARQTADAPSAEVEKILGEGLEHLRRVIECAQGAPIGEDAQRREGPRVGDAAPAAPSRSLGEDPELIREFVNEAAEHLTSIEAAVLALERDPTAADPLHATFRSFHTIKGLAGFLELPDIRAVSHEVETLLDHARNGKLAVTPSIIDIVLESADYLKRAISWVGAGLGGHAGEPPEFATLLRKVHAASETVAAEDKNSAGEVPPPRIGARDQREPVATSRDAATERSGEIETLTVRVDAAKLDYMMDMVGELVIAQSLLAHAPELAHTDGALQRNLQQLGRITGEVQRMAMSLRMMPVRQSYTRMTRVVRDLARKSGKRVRLELAGEETELDKTILEKLGDPLLHMVRNSLDHGLEPPEERVAKGKPAEGVLRLAASHQAGHIVIEVSDDGRGLNTEKILRKAREKGLVPEGNTPSETEIFHLIFEPGFSTADQVSDVSGRGVGMDVVRKQIQGLRGHIEIRSAPGRGSTFLLKLPLTLAIIDGLIVQVGAERYVMPISSVREMLRPAPEMLFTIENQAEMAMIRGQLIPILRLDRRFQISGAVQNPCDGLFIVAESRGRCFCLLVDSMLGKQEVVIKNLGETFGQVAGISGGAILGDGRVALILDVNGVLREAAAA